MVRPRVAARIGALVLLTLPAACGRSSGTGGAAPAQFALLPGTKSQMIAWDGHPRTYLLHRPEGLPPSSHPPLVVVLHGASLTADQTERYYHWDPLADADGFVVAYPQGINNAWNAGSCCGDAPDRGTDDIGFIGAVIADAAERTDADPSRRYLTGVSNGAMMTLRYECQRPRRLAAIGSVAGTFTSPCDHPPPVPFIAIHGLDDEVVTFAKSSSTAEAGPNMRLPALETIGRFLTADRCHDVVTRTAGSVHTQTASCASGLAVEVITVEGAGHQWPGAKLDAARRAVDGPRDQPSAAIDATAELWSFFAAHTVSQTER
ncbi:MAG: polyhydroxybutyrate depolymerase [Actinomycetota bacterium]|nr:polyhydroxybutyrate depolymerase [Actinomycetota bacterium]MDQ6947828.1 polyhydroxybutyrate depolymerase [Actinomycetota bacterium]